MFSNKIVPAIIFHLEIDKNCMNQHDKKWNIYLWLASMNV